MANRSYLYTIDFDRTQRAKTETDKVLSIGEWNYDVPLAFKILLSANPKVCNSIIWDYEHPIAIISDFDEGRTRLYTFLDTLSKAGLYDANTLQNDIKFTHEFLNRDDRRQRYFFLECGEIYEMSNDPLTEQNNRLLQSIIHYEQEIEQFYEQIKTVNQQITLIEQSLNTPPSFFQKLMGKSSGLDEKERKKLEDKLYKQNQEKYYLLGIDNWADVLYFDFEQ